jgi:hypothetical protein
MVIKLECTVCLEGKKIGTYGVYQGNTDQTSGHETDTRVSEILTLLNQNLYLLIDVDLNYELIC